MSVAAILAAPAALADSRSVSYSTWVIAGDTVTLRFILPAREALQLVGAEVPVLTSAKLGEYLLTHMAVRAAGRDCPAIDQGYDLGRVDPLAVGRDAYGFEIFYRCTELSDVQLINHAVIDRIPSHVNFARLEWGSHRGEALFSRARPSVRFATADALPQTSLSAYLRLGVTHVLHSLDRMTLLIAIVALARRKREAACAWLGLGAGYALALALAASGSAIPHEDLLAVWTALMIGLLAFAILLPQLDRPRIAAATWPVLLAIIGLIEAMRHTSAPAWLLIGGACFSGGFLAMAIARPALQWTQLIPALLFGFLDGFVLPVEQAPMQLPTHVQWPMLVGFDLGAWVTAALLMVAAGLFFAAGERTWVRAPLHHWRPFKQILAACLSAAGSYWLLAQLPI
jgi:hypothetical protein